MKKGMEHIINWLKGFSKHLTAFAGMVILAIILRLFSYSVSNPVSDKAYNQYFHSNYKVFGIALPKDLNFAGEQVPLGDYTIRESLERELLVNTYWQSQTLLFFKKCNRWFPVIEPILKRNNIPDDFKYIAVVESGFSNVVSPAGAAGFWQFVESTAKNYGLEITDEVDERYQVEKSTEAACRFFKEAFDKYHNWTLVAAAYNLGMGGIDKHLDKQKVTSYYDLFLNDETARYVFRLLAVKDILSRPKAYGFELRKKDLYPPLPTYPVKVDSAISDLADFAIKEGMTYKTLKLLNPWLRKSLLSNPGKKTYTLLFLKKGAQIYDPDDVQIQVPVPSDTAKFVSPAELLADSLTRPVIHTVQAQESFSAIAKKYGCTEGQLCKWNHLDEKSELKAGQELIILRTSK